MQVNKLTQKQADAMMSPMAIDFVAIYKVMQDEFLEMVEQAGEEGWTVDELIQKLEDRI